jgi:hypothetical protein
MRRLILVLLDELLVAKWHGCCRHPGYFLFGRPASRVQASLVMGQNPPRFGTDFSMQFGMFVVAVL